jgi:sulfite reductase (NADPH) flavoprotein alpha-component
MPPESAYSRKSPFPGTLAINRRLTGEGSNKETRHIEISLAGSGLHYEVGDSLGVFPSNDPALVELLLEQLGFSGGEECTIDSDGISCPMREALTRHFTITSPSRQLLQAVAEKDSSASFLKPILDPASRPHLEKFLRGRDILDVLEEFPAVNFSPEEFAGVLRKLQPRLYSIASAQKAVGDSAHLTVAVVRYAVGHSPRPRGGVCSTFLAERSGAGIPVFVHSTKHFRMPENPETPLIMVGPGTGIAPFRAFLQERQAAGTAGFSWLIFGEQHAATDFLYREEFEAALADGTLAKLTTAFSRDQGHKVYVQHRMEEEGAELFALLEKGAFFYVCGDAGHMARDVDAALHRVIEIHGGMTPERAKEYVDAMKKDKRYRKDVY